MREDAAVATLASVALIVFAMAVVYTSASRAAQQGTLSGFPVGNATLVHNGVSNSYLVYLAETPSLQEQGYMNSTTLGNCNSSPSRCLGMVFPFNNYGQLCFWMENTRIPLKQVWFNLSDQATYIYNATPYSTQAICHDGLFVLETSTNQSISIGDKLTFS